MSSNTPRFRPTAKPFSPGEGYPYHRDYPPHHQMQHHHHHHPPHGSYPSYAPQYYNPMVMGYPQQGMYPPMFYPMYNFHEGPPPPHDPMMPPFVPPPYPPPPRHHHPRAPPAPVPVSHPSTGSSSPSTARASPRPRQWKTGSRSSGTTPGPDASATSASPSPASFPASDASNPTSSPASDALPPHHPSLAIAGAPSHFFHDNDLTTNDPVVYFNCTRAHFCARDLSGRRASWQRTQSILSGTGPGLVVMHSPTRVVRMGSSPVPSSASSAETSATSSAPSSAATSTAVTPAPSASSTHDGTEATPSASSTAPSTPNWASILHQTTPGTKPKRAPVVSAPRAAAALVQATSEPAPDFNLSLQSAQPLGIILLRVMFDPNYRVTHAQLPRFDVTPHGLSNPGNICYMNSILQVLVFCEPFNQLLRLIHDKALASLANPSVTPLLDATIRFISGLVSAEPGVVSPEQFFAVVAKHPRFSHLKWGQQEDAEEFLGYYLDTLNDEFIAAVAGLNTPTVDALIQQFSVDNSADTVAFFKAMVKAAVASARGTRVDVQDDWSEVGRKNVSINHNNEQVPTPITRIFGGQMRSEVVTPKVPGARAVKKSVTLDPLQHIALDLDGVDSIEQALTKWNEVETIVLDAKQQAVVKKQNFIDKLPHILTIHLKRFSFGSGIEKLCKPIRYGHDLQVPRQIIYGPPSEVANLSYKLVGVVYHHGTSAANGHYTCDVATPEWVRVDDTVVTKIEAEEVVDTRDEARNAYILVYQRQE
ncbi:hypothetical protein DICA4_E30306 [Diutina catenulata]